LLEIAGVLGYEILRPCEKGLGQILVDLRVKVEEILSTLKVIDSSELEILTSIREENKGYIERKSK
jgi:hypothetical protein